MRLRRPSHSKFGPRHPHTENNYSVHDLWPPRTGLPFKASRANQDLYITSRSQVIINCVWHKQLQAVENPTFKLNWTIENVATRLPSMLRHSPSKLKYGESCKKCTFLPETRSNNPILLRECASPRIRRFLPKWRTWPSSRP